MSLVYLSDTDTDGKRIVSCENCGYTRLTKWPITHVHHVCPSGQATMGCGDYLHQLLKMLGVVPRDGCDCEAMRRQMNAWGPAGCREHREEILAHLRTAYDEASVATKMKAGVLALAKGLPLTLEGLLDEAIRRAEQAEAD